MAKSTAIELEKIPKDEDYEDYISAFLQGGRLYVERKVIHRKVKELLKLDCLYRSFRAVYRFSRTL